MKMTAQEYARRVRRVGPHSPLGTDCLWAFCVGGGICNEGETLMKPLREFISKERYSQCSDKQTEICVAKLGNDAGIIGAAFLGSHQ